MCSTSGQNLSAFRVYASPIPGSQDRVDIKKASRAAAVRGHSGAKLRCRVQITLSMVKKLAIYEATYFEKRSSRNFSMLLHARLILLGMTFLVVLSMLHSAWTSFH